MLILLRVIAACMVLAIAAFFAGPMTSGALLLLFPTVAQFQPQPHDLPADYTPVHHGHISLGVGLYFRSNEDLVVPGTPGLIVKRSYASSYRVSREFGIGTSHAADWYLVGDGQQFQWAELIRPDEFDVRFRRTSGGTSFWNAMYVHRGSDDWDRAWLGWTGVDWALRHPSGALARFRACGAVRGDRCSVESYRDEDGHSIRYRRDKAGRLERMESGGDQWVAFEYDAWNRITRASASTKREVRYEYDERGRLARVKSGDTVTHRYTYTDLDEMARIVEPDADIENIYDNGRCIRQVNRYSDGSPPFIFDFEYTLDGPRIAQTISRRSDGSWMQYSFDKAGYTTSETWGSGNYEPVSFIFERDPDTNLVVSLSMTCPDRSGKLLRHTSLVAPGREESVKSNLMQTHCSWTRQQWRSPR